MKVILVDNYAPDKQESMGRFAAMLKDSFTKKGINVRVIRPVAFFGAFSKSTVTGLGKWLGYADKWLLYPVVLLFVRIFNSAASFHICDHSNSPYVAYLPKKRTSITCHDVLAIRGALGHKDAYCEASTMGKVLQNWILKNLKKADKIACVSQLTLDQLTALNNGERKSGWVLVHNGFNANFTVLSESEWKSRINNAGYRQLTQQPYIVHVGSDLPRKNRKILLYMVHELKGKWNGNICFAGYLMDAELKQIAQELALTERIIEVQRPSHIVLEAIINGANAFVFPSFSEGFGWPVIEAQACGTPVIASTLPPMPEVGGEGAYYADPYQPEDFAAKLLTIEHLNALQQDELLEKGLENIKRFDTHLMADCYYQLIKA